MMTRTSRSIVASPSTDGGDRAEQPDTVKRVSDTVTAARDRLGTTLESLEERRPFRPDIDVTFSTYERDRDRGARLLAGALAYQFFFWLLPFVLVLVGGLGFLSASSTTAPEDLARSTGVAGFAAQSIGQVGADAEHVRLWALAVGLPALYFASVSFLKALMVTHSLIWGVPNHKLARKALAAAAMAGVLTAALLSVYLAAAVRSRTDGVGLIATLLVVVVIAALWLFVSLHMPRPETTWKDLLPGAIIVGVGVQIVHLVTVYYVSRKISGASSTYGALGSATGILLSLFLIARVLVVGAGLNAELWMRRERARGVGVQELAAHSSMWRRTRL
jgi:uncharacterized BrkB/YihY/UPF0761 family membrane protein